MLEDICLFLKVPFFFLHSFPLEQSRLNYRDTALIQLSNYPWIDHRREVISYLNKNF